MPKRSTIEDFWKKVSISDGCWNFTGWCNKKGYGYLHFQGECILAHRLTWRLINGDIPDGLLVCHKCDNPGCCNPQHLFLGTNADNMRDMKLKGRRKNINTCEKNGRANLSVLQVIRIREMKKMRGYFNWQLGVIFGVTEAMIGYIIRGDHWKTI